MLLLAISKADIYCLFLIFSKSNNIIGATKAMKGNSKDRPGGDSSSNKSSSTSAKLSSAEADPKLQQSQTANNKANEGKNLSLVINLSNLSNQSRSHGLELNVWVFRVLLSS